MTHLAVQQHESPVLQPCKRSGSGIRLDILWIMLVPLGAAAAYFGWPSPEAVMALGHPAMQIALIFVAVWVLRGERPNWFLSYTIIYLLLTGLLAEVWGTAEWRAVLISGQFLFSDPSGYVLDASRIVHGHEMNSQGAWRPIAHSFLATHLYLFGGNLRLIHLVYPLWQAASAVFAVRVISRRVHVVAALVTLSVVLAFLSHFAGVFMTEYVGVMLGCLAAGCIVEAAYRRNDAVMHLLGLAAISLAMLARAGAFFVLPALLAWSCCLVRDRWKDRAIFVILGLAVFAGTFFFNWALGELVADSPESMGNFYYTLYGMAIGETWESAIATGKSVEELRSESIRIIAERPLVLIEALIRGMRHYFGSGLDYGPGAYNDWMFKSVWLGRLLEASALAAVVAGFIWRRRRPLFLLIGFLLIGFLASLPFAPPWDAEARVYAATAPFSGLAAGAGMAIPFLLKRKELAGIHRSKGGLLLPISYLLSVLLVVAVIPIGLLTVLPNPEQVPARYEDGSLPILLNPGNYAILIEGADAHSYPPNLDRQTWLDGSESFAHYWANEHDFLEMVPAGALLTQKEGVGIYVLPLDALQKIGRVTAYHGYSTNVGRLPVFVDQSFPELIEQVEAYQSTHASNSRFPYLRGFNPAFYPWINHPALGSMWVNEEASTEDIVYLYSPDPAYGYLYTGPDLFPKLIRMSDNHELEYIAASSKVINRTTGDEMPLPKAAPAEGAE